MPVPEEVREAMARAIYPIQNVGMNDARAIAAVALSALEAAGWEVNRKGTREALERSLRAMKKLIREAIDRGKGHWPAWDEECALAVDHAAAMLTASNPKDKADV